MKRSWGKLAAFCLGLFLLIWILTHVGFEETLAQVRQVGWSFSWLLLPSLLMSVLFTAGWRWIVPPGVPFGHLFLIRTAGEAINVVTPLAYLGGEPLKASLLRRFGIPLSDALASVVVSKTTATFAYCLFIFLGLAAAPFRMEKASSALVGGIGAGLFLALSLVVLYYGQRQGLFSLLHRLIHRLGARGETWLPKREGVEILDGKIATLYRSRQAVVACFVLSLVGWLLTAVEAHLFLWAMGTPVDLVTALVIQALFLGVKAATFFVPANLGTQEGGTVLIFLGLGMSAEAAVAFSILRRAREVLWILAGIAVLARSGWPALRGQPEAEPGS